VGLLGAMDLPDRQVGSPEAPLLADRREGDLDPSALPAFSAVGLAGHRWNSVAGIPADHQVGLAIVPAGAQVRLPAAGPLVAQEAWASDPDVPAGLVGSAIVITCWKIPPPGIPSSHPQIGTAHSV
jgi:hypothetical protein